MSMPVLSVCRGSLQSSILVNMKEFTLLNGADTFAELLLLDDGEQQVEETRAQNPTQHLENGPLHYVPQKPGRIPLHQAFPEIVTTVTDFIQTHGFSAQSRRRSQTGNSMGVTLSDIRSHLLEQFPALKERGISRTVIHQLMVAPRKGTRNALRYTGLVQAKVPGKDNSQRKAHLDGHYAFAQANYVGELCQKFRDECVSISCDDMNKLHVGTLAVSRYHQLSHFFPLSDRPCYPDHDFPSRNSKIIPCGYMLLLPKSKQHHQHRPRSRSLTRPQRSQRTSARSHSESPERKPKKEEGSFKVDKLQRLHWTVPSTGPLHVFNRSTKFFKATSTEHASDLYRLFNEVPEAMKGVVNLEVDGGPDFSPKNMMNFVVHGRLWKDCNIDCLMVTTHAPGHSAYNKIEHAWAPLSRALTGVICLTPCRANCHQSSNQVWQVKSCAKN